MRRMILVLVVAAVLVAMTATAAFAGNQPIRNGSEDRAGVAGGSVGSKGGGPNGGGQDGGGQNGGDVGVSGGSLQNGSNGSDNSR